MTPATSIVIALVLAIITVTTFILNAFVLLALTFGYGQQVTSTFSKTLTVSLVTADLLISLTLMPKSLYEIVNGKWTGLLGEMMCRLFAGGDIFLCTTSIFHLAGLACDRYLAVCHPFVHRRLSVCWARVTCILFWLSSAAIGWSSLSTFTQVETANNFTEWHIETIIHINSTCKRSVNLIYFCFSILLGFVIPLAVITVFHVAIILTLRTPVTSLPPDSHAGRTLGRKWASSSEIRLEGGSSNTNKDLDDDMTREANVCTQNDLHTKDSDQVDHIEHKTVPQEPTTEAYQGQASSERIRTRNITLSSTKKQTGDRAMKTIACLVLFCDLLGANFSCNYDCRFR